MTRVMIVIPRFNRLTESVFGVEPAYNFETHRNVVHYDVYSGFYELISAKMCTTEGFTRQST